MGQHFLGRIFAPWPIFGIFLGQNYFFNAILIDFFNKGIIFQFSDLEKKFK
jgi:hypothetical protein